MRWWIRFHLIKWFDTGWTGCASSCVEINIDGIEKVIIFIGNPILVAPYVCAPGGWHVIGWTPNVWIIHRFTMAYSAWAWPRGSVLCAWSLTTTSTIGLGLVIAVDDEGMSRRRASWRTTTASAGRRPWRATRGHHEEYLATTCDKCPLEVLSNYMWQGSI
jgi:hypothetical protein